MEEGQFNTLCQKLDNITKLLALTYVKDIEIQKDKILILSAFGFSQWKLRAYWALPLTL